MLFRKRARPNGDTEPMPAAPPRPRTDELIARACEHSHRALDEMEALLDALIRKATTDVKEEGLDVAHANGGPTTKA